MERIKSNPCKVVGCGSTFHTAAFCPLKPKKPLKRQPLALVEYNAIMAEIGPKKHVTKASKKAKIKRISRGQLVRKLDAVFSQYIRLKDAIDSHAECVTCNGVQSWKLQQNGHFFTRGRYATRWDEMNCHVQDYRCNVALSGNYITYTRYMIDRYGREAVDALEAKSQTTMKITTPEIEAMIVDYTARVKELL